MQDKNKRQPVIKGFFDGELYMEDSMFFGHSFSEVEMLVLKMASMVKMQGEWLTGAILLDKIKEKYTIDKKSEIVLNYINLLLEAY